MYQFIRPFLFLLDPEQAHRYAIALLKQYSHFLRAISKLNLLNKPLFHPVDCFGLHFPNPIGLAAGLDKNGECIEAWQSFGFGFLELGTVTPRAQPGNPKPRLFRLQNDAGLINRMGFNNLGVACLIEEVKKANKRVPIGINIGKNRATDLADAPLDYLYCFRQVVPWADYVTVNLSSPNTPGLVDLQFGTLLKSLLQPLILEQEKWAQKLGRKVPILVKISPDLSIDAIKKLVDDLIALNVNGIIISNTTTARPQFLKSTDRVEAGGLSGAPLFVVSTEVVKIVHEHVGSALPIVAVGGIMSAQDAIAKLHAGAQLIQLYTGLIYQGPALIGKIHSALL